MTRLTVRLWAYVLVPLPVAAVCVSCYSWQLGLSTNILAPVSLVAVCVVTFMLGLLRGTRRQS